MSNSKTETHEQKMPGWALLLTLLLIVGGWVSMSWREALVTSFGGHVVAYQAVGILMLVFGVTGEIFRQVVSPADSHQRDVATFFCRLSAILAMIAIAYGCWYEQPWLYKVELHSVYRASFWGGIVVLILAIMNSYIRGEEDR